MTTHPRPDLEKLTELAGGHRLTGAYPIRKDCAVCHEEWPCQHYSDAYLEVFGEVLIWPSIAGKDWPEA